MAERDPSMSERVVKEAVGRAMETPMRDAVVEAVEESGGERRRRRRVGVASAFVAIGAVGGFLVGVLTGRRDLGETIVEEVEEQAPTIEPEPMVEEEPTGGGRRLRRTAIALGIVAVAGLVRRWMRSDEADEWDAIEEFGPDEETERATIGGEGRTSGEKGEEETVGDEDAGSTTSEGSSTGFEPVDVDPNAFDSSSEGSTDAVDDSGEEGLGGEDEGAFTDEERVEEDEE